MNKITPESSIEDKCKECERLVKDWKKARDLSLSKKVFAPLILSVVTLPQTENNKRIKNLKERQIKKLVKDLRPNEYLSIHRILVEKLPHLIPVEQSKEVRENAPVIREDVEKKITQYFEKLSKDKNARCTLRLFCAYLPFDIDEKDLVASVNEAKAAGLLNQEKDFPFLSNSNYQELDTIFSGFSKLRASILKTLEEEYFDIENSFSNEEVLEQILLEPVNKDFRDQYSPKIQNFYDNLTKTMEESEAGESKFEESEVGESKNEEF